MLTRPPDPREDSQLLAAAADGDREAFAELYRRHLPWLLVRLGFTVFEFVDYVAILKEMTDRRPRHDEVRRVIALAGLEPVSGKRIRALSGGMRRRVGLA